MLEMYVKNVDGFGGDGEFLSTFGLQVREEITFSLALRVFEQEAKYVLKRDRPLEGDLIWFPFTQALYQIKFVNKKPVFYQMGALQFYDVVCELFEYSSEIFNTGVNVIDTTYNALLTTNNPYFLFGENNNPLLDENGNDLIEEEYNLAYLDVSSQNQIFQTQGNQFIDYSEIDPFSESDRRA